MAARYRNTATGLTLIEVMVAIAVFSMVAITIWTATSQTARTRDIVTSVHDRYHQVRVAMEMMKRDLSSAFLSRHRALNEPSHDTVFIGRDSGDDDRVDFAAFTHQRRYLDAKESDQCEVGYFIADDPEISGQKNLIRRTSPILDLEPLEGGQYLTLVEDVVGLNLTYFDLEMNDWQDNWDTNDETAQADLLPHQVRITLVIHDRRGEEVTFGSQIAIPMRTPIYLSKGGFIPGPPIPVDK
jgi:general secretion pathway protein J